MGFNWGFTLRKADSDISVYLISFSGWNSKDVYDQLKCFSKPISESQYVFDFESAKMWFKTLSRIDDIFHGVSDRRKNDDTYSDEVAAEYADLCYDLGIEFDSMNIFTLERLNTFGKMLLQGDLIDEYYNKDWYLQLDGEE